MPARTMTSLRRAALAGAVLMVLGAPLASQGRRTLPPTLAITHVTVIDGRGGAPLRDQTVVVARGHIVEIAPARQSRVPAGATIVDGRGRFLIPGLWDMHVHHELGPPGWDRSRGREAGRTAFDALLLSHGVTGLREMGDSLALEVRWRDAVRRGALVAPRGFVTGFKLGDLAVVPGAPFPLRTADEVRRSITMLRDGGADFVKIGDGLPPALLAAAVAEGRRAGLPVVGHPPGRMTALEVSEAGVSSLEHLEGALLACDTNVATVLALVTRREAPLTLWERVKRRFGRPIERPSELPAMVAGFSDSLAEQLADALVRNQTWQTPTLRLWRRFDRPEVRRQMFTLYQRIVATMNRRGVRILAGSDAPTGEAAPGESLHEELAELVEAGLTPMQALQAATRSPAEFLGVLDSLGTVERGKVADLVLLEADPLQDIRNTRRVGAVVLAGRLLLRPALDSMVAEIGLPVQRGPRQASP